MKKFLLLLFCALIGLAAGAGGAVFLKPDGTGKPAQSSAKDSEAFEGKSSKKKDKAEKDNKGAHDDAKGSAKDQEFVKLNNQFVVPVVEQGRVRSLVILSLSLEVKPGSRERVYELEPRIRDTLLSVLFDHANSGGFSGSFTDAHAMAGLRTGLRSASTSLMGEDVKDVLVLDIVRQDVN